MKNRVLGREALICIFIVLGAYLCHIIAKNTQVFFLSNVFNFLRTGLYVGLFSAWGVSVGRRIMQAQVRRYLIGVSFLVIFWIILKEIRYRFVLDLFVSRHIWYAYYIAILLIPMLAVFVSLSLGRGSNYRLPKSAALLYLPTAFLAALVLTNDLHFKAFDFGGTENWSETSSYEYGPVFVALTVWVILLYAAAVTVMFFKSRSPNRRRVIKLTLIPLAAVGVYLILYVLRPEWLDAVYLDDLAVTESAMFVLFFEICVQCGLIQSNSRYFDLFNASKSLPVQILDNQCNIRYSTDGAEPADRQTVLSIGEDSSALIGGKRVYKMRIKGGFAVWSEDLTELIELRRTLEERQEELTVRNALLEHEYENEKRHNAIEEQNRLYDLLQNKTQRQLDIINEIVSQYRITQAESEKKRLLSKIIVLGSFIKRRKDFVLSVSSSRMLSDSKLKSAFAESYFALQKLNISGGFLVDTQRESIDGETLALAYDFFEDVLEAVMDKASSISVRVCDIDGVLREAIMLDCGCKADILYKKYRNLTVEEDGNETSLFLALEEGGEL